MNELKESEKAEEVSVNTISEDFFGEVGSINEIVAIQGGATPGCCQGAA